MSRVRQTQTPSVPQNKKGFASASSLKIVAQNKKQNRQVEEKKKQHRQVEGEEDVRRHTKGKKQHAQEGSAHAKNKARGAGKRRLHTGKIVCRNHLVRLVRRVGNHVVKSALPAYRVCTRGEDGAKPLTLERARQVSVSPPFEVRLRRGAADMLAEMVAVYSGNEVHNLVLLNQGSKPETVQKKDGSVIKRNTQMNIRALDTLHDLREHQNV